MILYDNLWHPAEEIRKEDLGLFFIQRVFTKQEGVCTDIDEIDAQRIMHVPYIAQVHMHRDNDSAKTQNRYAITKTSCRKNYQKRDRLQMYLFTLYGVLCRADFLASQGPRWWTPNEESTTNREAREEMQRKCIVWWLRNSSVYLQRRRSPAHAGSPLDKGPQPIHQHQWWVQTKGTNH